MELHFYTTYDNVQMLNEGDDIKVWVKDSAEPHHIHVSFDMDRYSFHKLDAGIFEVSKLPSNSIDIKVIETRLDLLKEIGICQNKNL